MIKNQLQIIQNLLTYIPVGNFRNGQENFYNEIRKAIIEGITRLYIEGPTGIGKTFLQATLADAIINGSNIDILILVPKKTLLHGMKEEFTKFIPHLSVGLVGDGYKEYGNHITIMTYQSFLLYPDTDLLQYSAIFLDEAHKSMGPQTKIKVDAQTHALVLGVTATSYYNEEKNLETWLGMCAHKITIPEAVQLGMISNIQYILEKVRIDLVEKAPEQSIAAYEEQVSSEIIRQGGNIAAAETYQKYFRPKDARFIMFTLTVNQGKDLVRELRMRGIKAEIIHGKTVDQGAVLRRFKKNAFQVLVGIDVIKEGFDDPGCSGVMFTYPIKSIVGLVQGGGRATRICDWIPNKIAYIVQMMFGAKGQVFYSSVLNNETLIVVPPKKTDKEPGPKAIPIDTREPWVTPTIENVIVDRVEMLEILREYQESTIRKVWTFEELQKEVRLNKIRSSKDYVKKSAQFSWPFFSTLVSMPEFPKKEDGSNNWDVFLGISRIRKNFLEIQTMVRSYKITSSQDYKEKAKLYSLPSPTHVALMPEFPKKEDGTNDWESFLAVKGLNRKVWTFEELQKEVRLHKIMSCTDYYKKYSQYRWPALDTVRKMSKFPKKQDGTNDWKAFLGL